MIVNKPETVAYLLRRLEDAKEIVVDVETSGLHWLTNHIIGWVLTDGPGPDDSFYVPVRHISGNLPSSEQVPMLSTSWNGSVHPVEAEIIKVLHGKKLVFHHGAFDMAFMHRVGWRPSGPIEDSMVAAYLIDELRPSMSLEDCCYEEKVQAKKGKQLYDAISAKMGCPADKTSMGYMWQMPADHPDVIDYSCGDGTSTWQLMEVLRKKMAEPYYKSSQTEYSLKRVAEVEFALLPILHKMSMRGIRVDEERLEQLIEEMGTEYEQAMEKVGSDMNVRSPIQVKAYFEKQGVTDWPLTEKGAPSFSERWLSTTEAGQAIVAVRKNRTLLDNFLLPMKNRFLRSGRVHTNFHQTRDMEYGTRTGRLSTTDPNLGAMPGKRQGALGRRFRSIFVPDVGMEFTEADYATCEIRICAHYCGARAWVNGLLNGIDPHTSISQEIGIPRKVAKTINLALMTGAGKEKIAMELASQGVESKDAYVFVDRYFNGLPELQTFQKQSTRVFRDRGFVSTLLGRRLQLAEPRKAYTAVNRLTQGGNADCIKAAMVNLDGLKAQTMLTVYDSALFQHEKGDKKAALEAVRTMVNLPAMGISLEVPMRAEYGSGANWGEATFKEEGWVECHGRTTDTVTYREECKG